MPTGYPKDPAAYAQRQVAAKAKRDAAKVRYEANKTPSNATPAKRVHSKKVTVPLVSPEMVRIDALEKDLASARGQLVEADVKIKSLETKLEESQRNYGSLMTEMGQLHDDFAAVVREKEEILGRYNGLIESNASKMETISDMRLYLFTVLDLVANQK
jgi:chromosome segregation ATPase